MKRRAIVLTVLLLLLSCPAALAQTNPCAQPALGIQFNPTRIYATVVLADHASPAITDYQVGAFADGVDPQAPGFNPVSTIAVPKDQWALVAGTTNCYEARPTEILALQVGSLRRATIRARGPAGNGVWSPASIDPFVLVGVPSILPAPRLGR